MQDTMRMHSAVSAGLSTRVRPEWNSLTVPESLRMEFWNCASLDFQTLLSSFVLLTFWEYLFFVLRHEAWIET